MNKDRKIDIMGIVNLTDDSYFAESRCSDPSMALRRAERLVNEGASILDIGACSTGAGSEPVGADEEWRRLEPALSLIRNELPDIPISIDTYWSSVVRRAHGLIGRFIVNDISAGEDDPEMLDTVEGLGLPYVAMHKRGTSKTMQSLTDYQDVVSDVLTYFKEFAVKAEAAGISEWILDPGFGFAKTVEQNYELMRGLAQFREGFPERRTLVGVSRKSMIYRYFGISPEDALPATQVLHLKALQEGADILRVHDVLEASRTVSLYRMLA